MKAAVITIFADNNYGNRLQNYAVQKILEGLHANVETLVFGTKKVSSKISIVQKLLHGLRSRFCMDAREMNFYKYLNFLIFDKAYIKERKIVYQNGRIPRSLANEYDYFVLGSDQVWNAEWYDGEILRKDAFLLTFARPEQKVCISPSFGVPNLPEKWNPWFAKYLATFPCITVREHSGAQIVKELTSKDALVTIDPTLMLDADDWKKIAKKPQKVDTDCGYILTYFLGGQSDKMCAYWQDISISKDLKVYNLLDSSSPALFVSGPAEFIYFIAHAKLVLTDSFHACVLSFLFDRPFQVFSRKGAENNMISRIDTLLNTFHMQRKYTCSGLPNELFECDYSEGKQQLAQEREKLINYLKNAMP